MDSFDKYLFEPRQYPLPVSIRQEDVDSFLSYIKKGSPADLELSISDDIVLTRSFIEEQTLENSSSTVNSTTVNESCPIELSSSIAPASHNEMVKVRVDGVLRYIEIDIDDPVRILQEGTRFLSDVCQLLPLMHRTMDILQEQTHSFAAMLYFVTQAKNEIIQAPRQVVSRYYITNWKIGKDSTMSAYVAATKTAVVVRDVWVDQRFPLGIGHKNLEVKAALGIPILSPEQELLGVLELSKEKDAGEYTIHDMDLVLMVCAWFGNIIYRREYTVLKTLTFSTIKSLIDLSTKVSEVPDEDMLMYKVLDICMQRLSAKAAYYYAFIPGSEGIVAEVYEYDKVLAKEHRRRRRLDKAKGTAAGYVAKTHERLNVRDVAEDKRFSETDEFMAQFTLTNILCQEVIRKDTPVGILQINNKAYNGVFGKQEEILYNIICSFLSYLLELIEKRKIKKHNMLMNQLVRATVRHHLTPCGECQQSVATSRLPLPVKVNAWDWVPSKSRDYLSIPTAMCSMLGQVLTPASLLKHRLDVLILTMHKIYHTISEKQAMAAFYKFHMMFCVLIRNKDKFRLTDIVAVLICVLFGHLAGVLQKPMEDPDEYKFVLSNRVYHQLNMLLHCLQVCEQMPEKTRKILDQELKTLVGVLDQPMIDQSVVSSEGFIPNSDDSLKLYLARIIQSEIGITSNSDEANRFNKNLTIVQSSNYHLCVRHFSHLTTQPATLIPLCFILGQVEPGDDWEEQFQFVIHFIELVALPQFQSLVDLFPNCSEVIELCTRLKVNCERVLAAEPMIDWKVGM